MSIAAVNLNYTYNRGSAFEKQALFDINLKIDEGEFVAIVGHTGSGKTTFLQHLNALIRLQSGELTVGDIDLTAKRVDLRRLRGTVGMVFQYPEYQLFADTVAADVAFGPKNIGIDKTDIEPLTRWALDLVGLDYDTVASKSPFDLSGGEKRRVALAGVLAMKPSVLVLDEPTAGLDPEGKREIMALVNRLNRERGITVIMVSHDMDEVYENARRVVVFKDGRVAYDLPPSELFSKEEEITEMNLAVPHVAQFVNTLRKNGINLGGEILTVDDAVDAVAAYRKGKSGQSV
jgi:energy-coupling factor transport system ATP-binding protein